MAENTNAAPRGRDGAQNHGNGSTNGRPASGRKALSLDASPLDAIRAAREVTHYRDGRKLKSQEAHVLLVLATYWPDVRPGLDTLARDANMSRGQLHEYVKKLERGGLLTTERRGPRRTARRLLHLSAPSPRGDS